MCIAEKHAYPWVEQVDTSKVAFGQGNRSIVAHGTLDNRIRIFMCKKERKLFHHISPFFASLLIIILTPVYPLCTPIDKLIL